MKMITDEFFRFWFKYVLPYRAELELGNTNDVLGRIRANCPDHLGSVFEIVARKMLWEYHDRIFPYAIKRMPAHSIGGSDQDERRPEEGMGQGDFSFTKTKTLIQDFEFGLAQGQFLPRAGLHFSIFQIVLIMVFTWAASISPAHKSRKNASAYPKIRRSTDKCNRPL
jgi:hypothetical protein